MSSHNNLQQQQPNNQRWSSRWSDIHIFSGHSGDIPVFTVALHQLQPTPQLTLQQQQVLAVAGGVIRAIPANLIVIRPPLPERRIDAEREFMQRFGNRIYSINDGLAHQYLYEQRIHWTINLGDGRQYTFHLRLSPRP